MYMENNVLKNLIMLFTHHSHRFILSLMSAPDAVEEQARQYLEALRWPDGRVQCPHCQAEDAGRRIRSRRPGLWACRVCQKQFTVTVGTLFEDSRLPLHIWLQAIELLCADRHGLSATDLQKRLGISYRTAWTLCAKLRYGLSEAPVTEALRQHRRPDAPRG